MIEKASLISRGVPVKPAKGDKIIYDRQSRAALFRRGNDEMEVILNVDHRRFEGMIFHDEADFHQAIRFLSIFNPEINFDEKMTMEGIEVNLR